MCTVVDDSNIKYRYYGLSRSLNNSVTRAADQIWGCVSLKLLVSHMAYKCQYCDDACPLYFIRIRGWLKLLHQSEVLYKGLSVDTIHLLGVWYKSPPK